MKRITLVFIAYLFTHSLFAQETARSPIGGRPNIKGDLFVEFGFNTLNNKPDELKTNFFRSRTVNIYHQYPVRIFGENSGFTFNPGLGLGLDKLAFTNDRNLFVNRETGSSQLLEIEDVYGEDIEVDGNNFSMNYVDIPLEFRYHFNKSNYDKGFRLTLGGKLGVLFDSQTKIAYTDANGLQRKIKDKQQYGLNPIRYGVYTKLGFPGFNVWGYYGLNSVFEKEKGPFNTEANQISMGISIALF